jgi:4'-phosphopantetheinyl transferase EntD
VHPARAILDGLFEPPVETNYLPADQRLGPDWPEAPRDAQETRRRGRLCAQQALLRAGAASGDVATGAEGEPLWPDGFVGSISHRQTLSIVAVSRTSHAASLGIDIEPDVPCSPELVRRVCSQRELARLTTLAERAEELARVVLSAKETLHKLQFPLTRQPSGLRRVEVLLEPSTFVARFIEAQAPFPAGFELRGRWCRGAGMIWTSACLPVLALGRPPR